MFCFVFVFVFFFFFFFFFFFWFGGGGGLVGDRPGLSFWIFNFMSREGSSSLRIEPSDMTIYPFPSIQVSSLQL